MADTMPQMPSEDEDFDAVLTPARRRKPRTPSQPVPNARTAPVQPTRSVAISVPSQTQENVESPQEAAYAEEVSQSEPEPAEEVVVAHKAPEFVEPFSQPAQLPRTTNKSSAKRFVIEVLLVLIITGLGLWTWQLYTDRTALRSRVSSLEANPEATIKQQTNGLISDVSKLLTLPVGETPTIANVSDASQARQQSPFFNNAQNGDKVLMYVKAGEAILYRPSTNKIILVAPLTFNSANASSSTSPVTTPKP